MALSSLIGRKISNLLLQDISETLPFLRGARNPFKKSQESLTDLRLFLQRFAQDIDASLEELDHAIGDVALVVTPATTTTISDSKIRAQSNITLTPLDANAAAELATLYVSVATGAITIHHTASALSRSFRYEITL